MPAGIGGDVGAVIVKKIALNIDFAGTVEKREFVVPQIGIVALEVRIVADVARDVVGARNVSTTPNPKTGSEDFADMLRAVPGAYFWLGHAGSAPVHNPGFTLDDGILPVGASLFARIVEARMPLAAAA